MTVYFHLPDVTHAAGGVRAVYRMVDACNAAGIDAAVLHQARGFRPGWFTSSTPVVAAEDMRVRGNDVLVVSELDAARLMPKAPGVTKIILNQHQYWTFSGGAVDYQHPDIASVIAVSDDGMRYLRCAFPGLSPYRLRYAVDPVLFRPRPKTRTVGYLTTKGDGPRTQVLTMLKGRGSLAEWTLRPLVGLSQVEMAKALGEMAVLASFSESEGFQMLLTEAMAAGTAVVGFDAGGGKEYLTNEVAWPVPAGDLVGFVEKIEAVTALHDEQPGAITVKTDRARRLVADRYTLAGEASDTIKAVAPAAGRAALLSAKPAFNVTEIRTRSDAIRERARAVSKALLR